MNSVPEALARQKSDFTSEGAPPPGLVGPNVPAEKPRLARRTLHLPPRPTATNDTPANVTPAGRDK
jgi:hypothetical protein